MLASSSSSSSDIAKPTQRLKVLHILELYAMWYVLIGCGAHATTTCVKLNGLGLLDEVSQVILNLHFPLISSELGLVGGLHLRLVFDCLKVRVWTQCPVEVDCRLAVVESFSRIITTRHLLLRLCEVVASPKHHVRTGLSPLVL